MEHKSAFGAVDWGVFNQVNQSQQGDGRKCSKHHGLAKKTVILFEDWVRPFYLATITRHLFIN